MFWGLIMEPQRRYTQKVKKAFHVSMAALDVSTSSEEPAQVMCGFQGRNYLLCTLRKPDMLQCHLDLNFDIGSEVSFAANGECHVHLTGYLQEEIYEEIEEENEEETSVTSKKRGKKALENGPPPKKSKISDEPEDEDEEDEDDSDFDVNAVLNQEVGSEIETDDNVEEEESSADEGAQQEEEDGEEEEEGSSEEEEDESSEEEEEQAPPKKGKEVKQNGLPKKGEVSAPGKKGAEQQQKKQEKNKEKTPIKEVVTPNKQNVKGQKRVLQGNVLIEDIKEGNGPAAKNGKVVNVFYEGRLKSNNKMFDSTTSGPGFKFRLGGGEVIKAWDVGVAGMKVGGKRRITCPPNMAYGQKGSPPAIPPNSTLVFEVELKKVN